MARVRQKATGPKGRSPANGPVEERKAEPGVLRGRAKPGATKIEQEAELMVEGLAMNTVMGLAFSTRLGTLDLTEAFAQILVRARETTERNTKSQEAVLAGQIISLNAAYTDLAIIARQNLSNPVVFERLMRLALKAQSNCRATAEALATIQNPPAVFARQANFANGPQQINNGSMPIPARVKNSELEPNKLLETDEQRVTERRSRQANAIRNWKPWERSTGPRSLAGKARVSRNAWKGGQRQRWRALCRLLNDEIRGYPVQL